MPEATEAAGSGVRANLRFWLCLSLAFGLFCGLYAWRAPGGRWWNEVFGARTLLECDPGGYYVGSAHELFTHEDAPLYPGHPGAPLRLLLSGTQYAYYHVAGDGRLGFTEFVARRLPEVYFASKLWMTLSHLASFWLLYRLALRILRSERGAVFAVLAYALSFPVLFYGARISVEGLQACCFLGTLLALSRCEELLQEGRRAGAHLWGGLAGSLAACGLVTKMHQLGPLPLFGLLILLASSALDSSRPRVPFRARALAGGSYVVASLATLGVFSLWIDWGDFFDLWFRLSRFGGAGEGSLLEGTLEATRGLVREASSEGLLRPDGLFSTAGGVFLASEALFLVLGAAGWILFLRRGAGRRAPALWLLAYQLFVVPVWLFRALRFGDLQGFGFAFTPFHYSFLTILPLAVFAGHAWDLALRPARLPRAAEWAATLGAALLLHALSIVAVVDARDHDVAKYDEQGRRLLALVRELGPGELVGIVTDDPEAEYYELRIHLVSGLSKGYMRGYTPRLLEEFHDLFVPIHPRGKTPPEIAARCIAVVNGNRIQRRGP